MLFVLSFPICKARIQTLLKPLRVPPIHVNKELKSQPSVMNQKFTTNYDFSNTINSTKVVQVGHR